MHCKRMIERKCKKRDVYFDNTFFTNNQREYTCELDGAKTDFNNCGIVYIHLIKFYVRT